MPPYAMTLSRRHCRTLQAVLAKPTRAGVSWSAVEALIAALGGTVEPGGRTGGSPRRLRLRGRRAVLHAPHPGDEMAKGSVESVRAFLVAAGVTLASEGCG